MTDPRLQLSSKMVICSTVPIGYSDLGYSSGRAVCCDLILHLPRTSVSPPTEVCRSLYQMRTESHKVILGCEGSSSCVRKSRIASQPPFFFYSSDISRAVHASFIKITAGCDNIITIEKNQNLHFSIF